MKTLIFLALSCIGLSSCTVSVDPQTLRPSFTLDVQSTEIIVDRLNDKIIEATK